MAASFREAPFRKAVGSNILTEASLASYLGASGDTGNPEEEALREEVLSRTLLGVEDRDLQACLLRKVGAS